MSKSFLEVVNVSYSYDSSVENILYDISFHLSSGWTGIVGANGAGKSTLLKLASGILTPSEGTIVKPVISEYCEQRTDEIPIHFQNLLSDYSKQAFRIIELLDIKAEWQERWETLSYGERKRIQIGTALWQNPELLAIDEPTNHLDSDARQKIINSLKEFSGIGLLVSHDRELLDELCGKIIFIENSDVIVMPGGFTAASEQHQLKIKSAKDEYNRSKEQVLKIEKGMEARKRLAEKSKSKSSKKKISRKDHDAKSKIDLGRLTGKDAVGGKLKRQLEGRLQQAQSALESKSLPKEINLGIFLPSNKSKRNFLVHIEQTQLNLGISRRLYAPDLWINPSDKIALTGLNGSGKSTFIKHIINNMSIPDDKCIYLPQELSIEESTSIIQSIKSVPNKQLGQLLIIVSRLGSDAKRILETELPSPGELRKLLLALGMLNEPELIIMDEPTNHLDLPSIECLENALSNVNCALLLVSHDKTFLSKLCHTYWHIQQTEADQYKLSSE